MTIDEYNKRLKLHGILSGVLLASVIGLGIYFLYDFLTNKPINIKDDLCTRLFLEAKGEQPELETYIISSNYLIALMPPDIKTDIIASKIIFEESGGVHDTWGDLDYKYPAYGICQMQKRTFIWLAEKAGEPYLEWKNREDQIFLLKWSINNGYCSLWSTCPLEI